MMALAPRDRSKLAAVLNRLDSTHAGEVAAAAAAATRLVRGKGLDWLDVLAGAEVSRRHDTYRPVPDHFSDLQTCGRRLDLLTVWEREFVTSLAQQRTPVSRRQREILAGVAIRVQAAGPRAG